MDEKEYNKQLVNFRDCQMRQIPTIAWVWWFLASNWKMKFYLLYDIICVTACNEKCELVQNQNKTVINYYPMLYFCVCTFESFCLRVCFVSCVNVCVNAFLKNRPVLGTT